MLEAESNAQIMFHDHHCHADFIKDIKYQDKIVEQVARLVKEAPEECDAAVFLAQAVPQPIKGSAKAAIQGSARQRNSYRHSDSASSI